MNKRDDEKDYSLFDQEEKILAQAEEMVLKLKEVGDWVNFLAVAFRKQYREQQRMVRLSDRMQLDLHSANQQLAEQAVELKSLNRALNEEIEGRKKLEDHLRTLATTDSLTGLLTRRSLFEMGEREIRRNVRNGLPLSFMLIDLDHFKMVNDKFGHAAGDEALVVFAEIGAKVLRSTDILGRLGGEEFGVILPEADLDSAFLIAERYRKEFASRPISFQGQEVMVTISIGVTELLSKEDTLEKAFTRADQALYLAKARGRNRTITWEAEENLNQAPTG